MAQIPESVMDYLRKIKALADRGATEGEKSVARALLDRLLEKHNVLYEDLFEEKKDWHIFRWTSDTERTLFVGCLFKIVSWDPDREPRISTWNPAKQGHMKNGWRVELTAQQFIDVSIYYEHYQREWQTLQVEIFNAFIQKNSLAKPADPNNPARKQLTDEEYMRLMELMGAVKRTTPLKQIGDGDASST
jgi:hypothetical protein